MPGICKRHVMTFSCYYRHQKLAVIRQESVSGDPCSICFEKVADTRLEPCTHR